MNTILEFAIEELVKMIRESTDPEGSVAKARKALEMDAFDKALDAAADAMLKAK
jgi:hypothetical protein